MANKIKNRVDFCKEIFGLGKDATDDELSHVVYKCTACGGWVATESDGVRIGTIVEGSDAEFEDFLLYPFTQRQWDAAWENIESLAEEAWEEG